MGYQHGRQAAALIRTYLQWIERLTGVRRAQLCANAVRFLPFIRSLSAPYIDEVHGLAQGAGISMEEALLCQVRAEAAQKWDGGCTCFALTGEATADRQPLAGQNQDLEPDYSDIAIVLKVRPDDGRPRAIMFTFAGQLGYAGMNEFGVCQFTNALYDFQWHPGLPYYPLRRVMMEQRTVKACLELLRKARMCSAVNFVLADGTGDIADVEVRPDGMALFDDRLNRRLHTNHYLTQRFAPCETFSLKDSVPRLSRVRELVDQSWGRITVETMKNILADHSGTPASICRHGAQNMVSVSGYIAEPTKKLFHVRRGAGCDQNWTTYQV
jgi:hypothetical protein